MSNSTKTDKSLDLALVDVILNRLIAYHGPGKVAAFLDLLLELEEFEQHHPREYFRAVKVYKRQYAPKKERKGYGRS